MAAAWRKRKAEAHTGPTAAAKRARPVFNNPLESTHIWLCSMNSAMDDSLGHGLEKRRSSQPHRAYNDDFEENERDTEHYLTFCMDEEQKQLAAFCYLERKASLNVFRIMSSLHRRHNGMVNSLVRAGCYELVALSVLQRNIAYGPWGKGGNLQVLWESGLEMVRQLGPDDAFLCKLWGRICRDRGWSEPAECDREARSRLVVAFSAFRPFVVKGPRAALAKWMSCLKAIVYEKPDATPKRMGIVIMAVHHGWVEDVHDFFGAPTPLAVMREKAMAAHFPEPAASAQASGSGGSKDPAPSLAIASAPCRGQAKAKARSQVNKLMGKNPNALAEVGRLIANQDFRDLQEVALVLYEGLMEEHAWCVQVMKTREGVHDYYIEMSQGRWLEPLWGAVDCPRQWHKFGDVCALTTEFTKRLKKQGAGESHVLAEDSFCEVIWRLTISLVAERAASCQFHVGSYPGLLAGILGDGEAQIQTMATFKSHWEAYCSARACLLPKVQALCLRSPVNTRHGAACAHRESIGLVGEPGFQGEGCIDLRGVVLRGHLGGFAREGAGHGVSGWELQGAPALQELRGSSHEEAVGTMGARRGADQPRLADRGHERRVQLLLPLQGI